MVEKKEKKKGMMMMMMMMMTMKPKTRVRDTANHTHSQVGKNPLQLSTNGDARWTLLAGPKIRCWLGEPVQRYPKHGRNDQWG